MPEQVEVRIRSSCWEAAAAGAMGEPQAGDAPRAAGRKMEPGLTFPSCTCFQSRERFGIC